MVDVDAIRNCGICCGGFSLFAMIFLLSVGGLIGNGSELIHIQNSERAGAASTLYYAALIYFITFLLSIACFFGPMFIKRNSDLEGLRARSAGGVRGGRFGAPDDL